MENASKALIIAGAILISILLISVGILIFNSVSGMTDNSNASGDAMEIAARKERVKIILSNIDVKDDNDFFEYIRANYGKGEYIHEGNINNITKKKLTEEEARELCELVVQRSIMFYGEAYMKKTIHLTSDVDSKIYYDTTNKKIVDNTEQNKKYDAGMYRNINQGWGYSVRIIENK